MSVEIKVPTLGESVTEATVGQWFKKVGDTVAADEPLVELETDKVTVEVPAPSAGTLEAIAAKEGETVNVGGLLGALAAAGVAVKPAAAAAAASPAKLAGEQTPSLELNGQPGGNVPPSPSASKLMAENGIANGSIAGSGKHGQVLKEDALAAIAHPSASLTSAAAPVAMPQMRTAEPAPAARPASPSPAPIPRGPTLAEDAGREERVRMTRLRTTIARRLKDAQNTAAMLTTFNEVDMKPVMDLRAQYKDVFEKKHGVKLGFMGFFTLAVVHALKEIPNVNAEIDGDDIVYKNYCHVGMAVGTDRGLVVPVVRNADQLSIAGVEKEIARLAKLARDGQLSMADMQGGTFTITNGGVYGSLMSTPILNAPQSGILGMHKIQERPVVVGGQIVVRPMMYLALSYDHRIVDGKEAVTFLVRVKESLEAPERLVLDL
ncbi:MAG TPA: 2-oxoglutarate dehydrogenase complex dihydrolipoyllysine-residue succinyltransferase [Devosiaceae bacterium]|nr:2-oxoglutarate dehydrogenase complex dihydrolipoyllysine-residue succinyltransferase [Devosiaceae bacterium]